MLLPERKKVELRKLGVGVELEKESARCFDRSIEHLYGIRNR